MPPKQTKKATTTKVAAETTAPAPVTAQEPKQTTTTKKEVKATQAKVADVKPASEQKEENKAQVVVEEKKVVKAPKDTKVATKKVEEPATPAAKPETTQQETKKPEAAKAVKAPKQTPVAKKTASVTTNDAKKTDKNTMSDNVKKALTTSKDVVVTITTPVLSKAQKKKLKVQAQELGVDFIKVNLPNGDVTAPLKKTLAQISQSEKPKRKSTASQQPATKKTKLNSGATKDNKGSDDDGDDSSDDEDWMQDVDKDEYAEDMTTHSPDGQALVNLTPAVIKAAAVRFSEDDMVEDMIQKERERIYLRKKAADADSKTDKVIDPEAEKERLQRTVFLSNVPNHAKESDVKNFLGRDVAIESLRYRAAGFDTTKVARWVAFAKGQFHEKRDTLCVYVVLKNRSDMAKVLRLNQTVMLDKHIRVDSAANDGKVDHTKSIFVGNLPFDITEETLYTIFSRVGTIYNVRVPRESKTGMGRGIAFVTFNERLAVSSGLKLDGKKYQELGARPIRVTKVSPQAFDKTESWKVQLTKQRVLNEKKKQLQKVKSRSERLRQSVLGADEEEGDKKGKRVNLQGAFQKTFGNSGAGGLSKKPRHNRESKTAAPSWQGTAAKPSDSLGRNKAAKTAKNAKDKHIRSIKKK